MRRWNGWGDEDFYKSLSVSARDFLESRLGKGDVPTDMTLDYACAKVPESRLTTKSTTLDTRSESRLRHAHGQSFSDWAALRHGLVGPFPDAVAAPANHEQTREIIDHARRLGAVLVPYGGGTSVVGHLRFVDDDRPVICVDMSRNAQLLALDAQDRIARIGAGAPGPVLEAQLRAKGFVLGHYPQSFEYSTLGGWIVTRSAGQQSRRYGRIEDLLFAARLAAPDGDLAIGGQVASSAGPDLRQLLMGSEGRMGLVTEADVHVRPVASHESFHSVFFSDWASAQIAARQITQAGTPVSMLRVSNAEETDTHLRIAGHESAIAWLRRYLNWRNVGDRPCMMMLGVTADSAGQARRIRGDALSIARGAGGRWLGTRLGSVWASNRFAGAYLRNTLWDAGFAVDTMETAVPWSRTQSTMEAMEQAARDALAAANEQALAFSHLSHVYDAGSSLYMTVIWRRGPDYDTDMMRWRALKTAVSQAIVAAGATISHQHGVGIDHAPYLAAEKSHSGLAMIEAVLAEIDPQQMMNPGVLTAGRSHVD